MSKNMHQCHQHYGKIALKGVCHFSAIVIAITMIMLPAYAEKSTSNADSLIKQFLLKQANGLPGKINITVSAPTAALPACSSPIGAQAFLPSGARVWGRVSVGVRCHKSATQAEWTRYVPAYVAVVSNYLITNKPIAAGQTLSANDFSEKEGDLTKLPRNIITDAAQINGKMARNRLAQGVPIRAELIKSVVLIKQGQTVKVSFQGMGFIASTEGRAMSHGSAGEKLQVKSQS
ncbi:MAG: flagellar basal body P-ring formation chaperone FlgA, partial [Glaciimonas sp.]|nr:flagellar basal body P-ring formation chaperone FlgA [Glaciimonas sp.]